MPIEFDRLDITDFTIILALSVGLIMSIHFSQKELSMSIVSGMFGYIGGSYTKNGKSEKENDKIRLTDKVETFSKTMK